MVIYGTDRHILYRSRLPTWAFCHIYDHTLFSLMYFKKLFLPLACFLVPQFANANPATLVYKSTFDSVDELNNWVMEGPGVAEIDDGRLLLYSKWLPELENVEDEIDLTEPGGSNYYPYIEKWVKEREPENLEKYILKKSKSSNFNGGHLQFWNKEAHPENVLIRLKFQPANPNPLHMISFSARGVGGESIFDPSLAPRYGLGGQYMSGELTNYRISYWSGPRGTSHMRRAPGRKLTSQNLGDIPRHALEQEVQLELFRWEGRTVFKCDGETVIDWTDDDPLGDGFFSIRLMAAAKGWYDDYEVYELHEDPFTYTGQGESITSRLSAQKDIPKADDIVDGKYIVVGNREPRGILKRNVINSYKGHPVYHFSATPDVNRIELTTCYGSNLEGLSQQKLAELIATKNIYAYNNQGRYDDTITYDWYARFPEPLKEDAKGIFAQWHGRPDRTLVETPEGEIKQLPAKDYIALHKRMTFDGDQGYIGIDPETGKPNGWKIDGSSGGPIGAFKFQDGFMCLLVRNDPHPRSNNRIRIKPKPGGIQPIHKIGDKTGAVVYETPISKVPINQWIHFKVQIKYSSYSLESDKPLAPGFVKVWINEQQVADWKGDIGKNDEKGPYFKYGIYKPGADGFKVDCAGFSQTIQSL